MVCICSFLVLSEKCRSQSGRRCQGGRCSGWLSDVLGWSRRHRHIDYEEFGNGRSSFATCEYGQGCLCWNKKCKTRSCRQSYFLECHSDTCFCAFVQLGILSRGLPKTKTWAIFQSCYVCVIIRIHHSGQQTWCPFVDTGVGDRFGKSRRFNHAVLPASHLLPERSRTGVTFCLIMGLGLAWILDSGWTLYSVQYLTLHCYPLKPSTSFHQYLKFKKSFGNVSHCDTKSSSSDSGMCKWEMLLKSGQ